MVRRARGLENLGVVGNATPGTVDTQCAAVSPSFRALHHYADLYVPLLLVHPGKGSEIGDFLTTHPLVSCISFTGGDTGINICRKAGMVPVQMELGGKDVCIVCR